jgi:hypothetical protein
MAQMKNLFDEFIDATQAVEMIYTESPKVIDEWHEKQGARFIYDYAITSHDVFVEAVNSLEKAYKEGTSDTLLDALNEIANIPLMTSEVMQELVYQAARRVPQANIIGLNKISVEMFA